MIELYSLVRKLKEGNLRLLEDKKNIAVNLKICEM